VKGNTGFHVGWLVPYAPTPLALGVFYWLGHTRFMAKTPFWLLVVLLVAGGIGNAGALVWTRQRSRRVRVHVRSAMAALTTTAFIYATGWGAMLVIGYALGIADVITSEDGDAWLAATLWTALGVGTGEALVAAHLAPSLIDRGIGHVVALGGFMCAAVLLRLFAISTRAAHDARCAVEESEHRFRSLVQHAQDVIAVLDLDGTIVYVSPAIERLLGYTPRDCEGQPIGEVLRDERRGSQLAPLSEILSDSQRGPFKLEAQVPHRSGSPRIIEVTMTMLDGSLIAANIHDLTERRLLEDELRYQANTDALTGLMNRAAITHQLEQVLAREVTTVLFIDLDGFKQVNDRLGHERGDAVLVEAAARLETSLGHAAMVGRLGGDEFLAILPSTGQLIASSTADSILAALNAPWPEEAAITASIGIATSGPAECAEDLMHRADTAMYEAKRRGRARWRAAA
jgi:diguanylate cyclase (GGDEF)-like protein/PAS domain S-box-containing protein